MYSEGYLGGEAAERVGRLCLDWGLSVDCDEVDHAGAELEASLLAMDTRDSLEAADRFLREHLRAWLPRFAADLAAESRLSFYRALGNILSAILEAEHEPTRSLR